MKIPFLTVILSLPLTVLNCNSFKENPSNPNIIIILADDLGYGELGVYGQKIIQTPHIDALARNGMRFTQHYSGSPVCAPSRYILLTGLHSGHAHIRGNDEWSERGDVWNYSAAVADASLEGQRPIPDSTFTLGEMLQKSGYTTGLVGKWGLGAPGTVSTPNKQGFDYFYGYNCQRQAHNLYPRHLWENEQKIWLNNEIIPPGKILDSLANPNDSKSYSIFEQDQYAPSLMHEKALNFIEKNKENQFFLYYATPLPHLPLQIPKKYQSKYRDIIGTEMPYKGGKGYFPNQYPKATYAAMISYLDQQVGELVQELKRLGLYENTLIIFTSDNGPTYNIGGVDPHYFNSAGPFHTGRGWGKGFIHEGGIRVPMIVTWPNQIEANTMTTHLSAFWDIFPTLAEISGYENNQMYDGISFKPTLNGKKQPQHDYLYWEFPEYGGQQAVRKKQWKAIRKNLHKDNLNIALFDLSKDPLEDNDISDQYPEKVAEMETIMREAHSDPIIDEFNLNILGDK